MKAENYIVSMTALEVALVALILMAVTTALGAAGGFYLGTRVLETQTVDNSREVLALCNKVVDHEEDRVQGWKSTNVACEAEVARYRTWVTDVEDATKMRATVTHGKRASRGGQ